MGAKVLCGMRRMVVTSKAVIICMKEAYYIQWYAGVVKHLPETRTRTTTLSPLGTAGLQKSQVSTGCLKGVNDEVFHGVISNCWFGFRLW